MTLDVNNTDGLLVSDFALVYHISFAGDLMSTLTLCFAPHLPAGPEGYLSVVHRVNQLSRRRRQEALERICSRRISRCKTTHSAFAETVDADVFLNLL